MNFVFCLVKFRNLSGELFNNLLVPLEDWVFLGFEFDYRSNHTITDFRLTPVDQILCQFVEILN